MLDLARGDLPRGYKRLHYDASALLHDRSRRREEQDTTTVALTDRDGVAVFPGHNDPAVTLRMSPYLMRAAVSNHVPPGLTP